MCEVKEDWLAGFQAGRERALYSWLGGSLTGDGARFAVWAPGASAVSVTGDFCGWGEGVSMTRREGGVWDCTVPGLKKYDAYKYAVTDSNGRTVLKADPMARHGETRPGTASRLWESDFVWDDGDWLAYRRANPVYGRPLSIYELHLGSWRRPGEGFLDYRTIADELAPYVKGLGFTHVELLPVLEHPLDASWGYQCTGYFAVTARYGTPDDFKYFVDTLHRAGVGVILDWVPAHFPKDEHGLYEFDGGCLYEYSDPLLREHPSWGTRVFDYGRGEVRSFLISSACFWLEEYHADGLRVDAVASMLYLDYDRSPGGWHPNRYGGRENLEAIELLRELNQAAFALDESVLMIAEESTAWPMVTKPTYVGGLGFNLKWNMGWMNDTLHYIKLDPIYRQYNHKDITFSLMYAFSENYVLPLSHDEVVHMKGSLIRKMPGDYPEQLAGLRLLWVYMLAHPGKKLLFMGAELGQYSEWHYEGELDWFELEKPERRQLFDFFGEAGAFYLSRRELWELDFQPEGFRWVCCDDNRGNTAAFIRRAKDGGTLYFLCNFSPVDRVGYRLGVEEPGDYEVVFDSASPRFGGESPPQTLRAEKHGWHGLPCSIELRLPPLGGLFIGKL